jgi:hypothetical protein
VRLPCIVWRRFRRRWGLRSSLGDSVGNQITDAFDQSGRALVGQDAALDCGFREWPEDRRCQRQDDHRADADRQASHPIAAAEDFPNNRNVVE